MSDQILDQAGRSIEYLRISVTDRCNLRCRYCMPPQGIERKAHDDILRYEEIARAVAAMAPIGLRRVRLTGGEPLVRPGLPDLVRLIRGIPEIEDIAVTTNGVLLADYAQDLWDAGVQRINVSLDTLRPGRFSEITQGGNLDKVLEGLRAAEAIGMRPIKVNAVLVRGMNDDEVVDFARLTLEKPYDVRFIEFMPMGDVGLWSEDAVVPEQEARAEIERIAPLQAAKSPATSRGGDAWRLPEAAGTLAFISPVSSPFCGSCNRLRLTSDGQLRPCLLSDQTVDLRAVLRSGGTDDDIREAFRAAARSKPDGHTLGEGGACHTKTPMTSIGG